jgi:hypothetical protein
MSSIVKRFGNDMLKEGVVFDDDADRQDFTDSILQHGDHDAQVAKLNDDANSTQNNPTDSLKENERARYHKESRESYRPSLADITFIPDIPIQYSERTHNQIRLTQQDNASRAKLLNRYNNRFK